MLSRIKSIFKPSKEQKFLRSYKKPEILEKLELYQNRKKANWEKLEFYIKYDNLYGVTPIDVIPFAYTGNNGIHFGFLTDFNTVENLDEAAIVCVAPSYDPPINIVAKNLKSFLSFICYAEYASLLADIYESQIDFESRKEEFLKIFTGEKVIAERKKTIDILQKDFLIETEENIIQKINSLKKERKERINTETVDGIGIVFEKTSEILEFDYSKNLVAIKNFFYESNFNSRLKFYRQSTFIYIIGDLYDKNIKSILVENLKKDGFKMESDIVNKYYL